MAKKIVSLLLAGVMVLSMTACGSKGEEETKKQEKTEIVRASILAFYLKSNSSGSVGEFGRGI